MKMGFVSEGIENYCGRKSTVPSRRCEAVLKHTVKRVPYSQMLIGPLEGSFLGFLVSLARAKRVLEIGCFTGYSALAMAERLPKTGRLITLDINPETNRIARKFWAKSPHGNKIRSVLGPALKTLTKLNGPFDLIFIDADKTNYLNYLKKGLPLLSPKGLIVVDNCLWGGEVLKKRTKDPDTRAIQRFNNYVKNRNDLEAVLLPVRDGVFLIQKK